MTQMMLRALEHSIQKNGPEIKKIIAMEEMAELTQQISKDLRGQLDRDHLIEEYADVMICMQMLKLIHHMSDGEINAVIEAKIGRQMQRDGITLPELASGCDGCEWQDPTQDQCFDGHLQSVGCKEWDGEQD